MENIKKGAVVVKSAPTAGDMALINAQSLRELKAEEVFTFRVAAADTQVDRDFEHFSRACLEKLAELFVGRTVISDHRWSSENQVARVYAGKVETAEDGVSRLLLSCYMLRSDATQPTIDAIEAGILREASVGVAVKRAVCSICGADKSGGYCEHRPGRAYGGMLCTVELDEPTEAYEVSFVAVPAQREAGVVKSYAGDKAGPQKDVSTGEPGTSFGLQPNDRPGSAGDTSAARRKTLAAMIELEKIRFIEEVPET